MLRWWSILRKRHGKQHYYDDVGIYRSITNRKFMRARVWFGSDLIDQRQEQRATNKVEHNDVIKWETVTQSFDFLFDLHLNKRLGKQ